MRLRTCIILHLLAYFSACTFSFPQRGPSCPSADDGYDADVLIIGAGLAGITAAKTLHERGVTNLLVLEAHDRIGGRLRSEMFGGMRVEVGSQWLPGAHVHAALHDGWKFPYKKNPIQGMIQACDLQAVTAVMSKRLLYNVTGPFGETNKELTHYFRLLDKLRDYSIERKKKRLPDVTAKLALKECGWEWNSNNNSQILKDLLVSAMFLFVFLQPPETLSLYRGFPMTMWDFGETGFLVTDQRGSEHLVRCVADDFNLTEKDRRLQLNTLVNDVKWNGECVCVTATQGARKKSYCAKYAISTVSIGALQSEVLRFDPPLPKWKQDAINKFGMTHLLKVFVKFNYSFWDQYKTYQFIERFDKTIDWYNIIQPLDSLSYGIQTPTPVLQFSVMGKMADRVLSQPLDKTKGEILEVLRSAFPEALIPEPEDIMITKWKSDPLFGGTSTTRPVGITDRDHEDLSAPIGRLYISGSAIHKSYGATVLGAYYAGKWSGDEVADHIMFTMSHWI